MSEVLLKWWNALIIVQKFKKMMPNLIHRWNEKWSFALRISSSFVQWSKAKLFQTLFQDNSKYGNDGLYNFFWYIFLLYHILFTLSYTNFLTLQQTLLIYINISKTRMRIQTQESCVLPYIVHRLHIFEKIYTLLLLFSECGFFWYFSLKKNLHF